MNINILLTIAMAVVIFLLFREVLWWYWKINERIVVLKENITLQKEIIRLLENKNSATTDVTTEFSIDADGVKRYN